MLQDVSSPHYNLQTKDLTLKFITFSFTALFRRCSLRAMPSGSAMKLPSFSYSVSRPYPYKWFTWFVVVGGICATVFFSVLSLAANGYVPDVQYCPDYNKTMAQKRWTQQFPFSIADKVPPVCQSQDITVNTQFLTNNSALPYTLTSVSQRKGNATVTLPSLRYTNNILESCTVAFIEIELESTQQRSAAQMGWVVWGPKAFVSTPFLLLVPRYTRQ